MGIAIIKLNGHKWKMWLDWRKDPFQSKCKQPGTVLDSKFGAFEATVMIIVDYGLDFPIAPLGVFVYLIYFSFVVSHSAICWHRPNEVACVLSGQVNFRLILNDICDHINSPHLD